MNKLEQFNSSMENYYRPRVQQGGDHSQPQSASSSSERVDLNTSYKRSKERARSGLTSARSQKSETQKLKGEIETLKTQVKRLQATNVLLRKNFHRDKLDKDLVENMDLAQMLEESAIEAQMQLKMYEAGNIDEKNLSPKVQAYIEDLRGDSQRLKGVLEKELKKRTHLQQAYDYLKTSRDKMEEDYRKLKKEEVKRLALPTIADQRMMITKYESMIDDLKNEIREKDILLKKHRGVLPSILGHRPHTEPDDSSKLEQAIYILKRDLEIERERGRDLETLKHENEKLRFVIQMLKEKIEAEGIKLAEEKLEMSKELLEQKRRLELKEEELRMMDFQLPDRSRDLDSSNVKLTATPESARLQMELAKRKSEWEKDKLETSLKINELRKELNATKQTLKKVTDELEEAKREQTSSTSKDRKKTTKGKGRQPQGQDTEMKASKRALERKEKELHEAGLEIANLKKKLADAKNQQPSEQRVQSASQRVVTLQEKLKEEKTLHSRALKKIEDLERTCHEAFEKMVKLETKSKEETRTSKETIQRKDKTIMDLRKQINTMEDSKV